MLLMMVMRIVSIISLLTIFSLVAASVMKKRFAGEPSVTSARLMFKPRRRRASHVSSSCPKTSPKETVTTVASGSAVLSMSTTGMPWSESFITSSMDAVAYAGEKRDGARVAYGLRAYGQEERFSDTRTTRERSEESAVAVRLRRDERHKKTERKDPFPRAKRHDWGQRTPRPRGAAPTGDSTRGASRGGGGATKRRRPRGDRDASRARVRVARLRGRDHIVRASCRRRRVARRFGT